MVSQELSQLEEDKQEEVTKQNEELVCDRRDEDSAADMGE